MASIKFLSSKDIHESTVIIEKIIFGLGVLICWVRHCVDKHQLLMDGGWRVMREFVPHPMNPIMLK